MVEAQNALRTNNRRFIYEAFKKLKIGNDKEGFLKFYVKKSKTGKNLIVFKGYSGLRGFLTSTKYGVNHLKVGMIASSSSVYAAATTAGLRSAVSSTVKAAGKSLGGIGFGIVATFEVAEWLASDDPFNNWSDLWLGLGSSAIKGAIATAAGVAAGAAIIALRGVAVGAVAVVAVGFIAVVIVSAGLEFLDRHFGITDRAKQYSNELGY